MQVVGSVTKEISGIMPDRIFALWVDLTVFPLAKMYGEHEIVEKDGRTFLTHAIKIDGLLSPLWRKLVANRVADKLEEDMDLMIGLAIDGKQHRF